MPNKVTIPTLLQMTQRGEKIVMLTAYDYPMGKLLDESGVDVILVGDSLGMVVLGYDSTTPVTMDEMLHHSKAARRGVKNALLVGDMPFMSFHGSRVDTVKNAARFIQEAGCDAVKVEWKTGIEDVVKALVDAGIPVMGHVGLTPQTAAGDGGFKVRGRDAAGASRIVAQAIALQEAGCFSLVVECVPEPVGAEISERLAIPTIGIGAGRFCDGQVLVTSDLLGLFEDFTPKFARRYAPLGALARDAAANFIRDVRQGAFPAKDETFAMSPEELERLKQDLG